MAHLGLIMLFGDLRDLSSQGSLGLEIVSILYRAQKSFSEGLWGLLWLTWVSKCSHKLSGLNGLNKTGIKII